MENSTAYPVKSRPPDAVEIEPEQIANLEFALEYAMERRWYDDDFDAGTALIQEPDHDDIQIKSRFLQILELAHGEDVARSLHLANMQNVISSFRDGSHSLVFALRGARQHIGMYMGVRRLGDDDRIQTSNYIEVLRRALRSNLPGIVLGEKVLPHDTCEDEILHPLANSSHLACVTGIPSLKQDAATLFIQSLDRLVDGLRGEEYTLLVLAEPIREATVLEAVHRCRLLSQEIHNLVRRSIAANETATRTIGKTISRGTTVGIGTGALLGILFNINAGRQYQAGESQQIGQSRGTSVTYEALNKTAEFCECLLDHYLNRLQNGRNLGFWNVGLYLASENFNTFLRAQGIVRGLFSGKDTQFEPLRVLDLSSAPAEARRSLEKLRNPALLPEHGKQHPLGDEFQHLATPLTSEELSILLSLPRREVPGVKLTPMADFGLNPPPSDGISLGNVIYRGDTLADEVTIPLKHLTKHAFITGITGAGKTNTCLVLLRAAAANDVPFLVIEPAKTEYRPLLDDPELRTTPWVFTLGDEDAGSAPFRFNPFEFTRGFPLLTHIDLLKAVFNATFPMYASMPFILEEAILDVYIERGWDIARSENRYVRDPKGDITPYLPRLEDLYEKIDEVVARKRYAQQVTMDISAALKARLASLLNGGKGRMLNVPRSIPFDTLLSRPAVLELRRVGDDDEKAFVMALLLVRLYEEREVGGASDTLVHLTLIEEAHRLLRNVPLGVSMESANARGKAVEMFTDILAEVREYGEGMVIVDQVPSKLAPDVVKNTNLKVLHRIVAQDDRDFVGNAMNLSDFQKQHVVRLRPGQAVVHTEGLDEPMLVEIKPIKDDLKKRRRAAEEAGDTVGVRMETIRTDFPLVFQRYIGCQVCDAPCLYFSDQNRVSPPTLAAFKRLYRALRLSPVDAILPVWQRAQPLILRHLSPEAGQTEIASGALLCHLVQLAESVVGESFRYYGRGHARYGGAVHARRVLAVVLQRLVYGPHDSTLTNAISAFRYVLAGDLATAPAQSMPGCSLCQRVCGYGFDVQAELRKHRPALNKALKAFAQDQTHTGQYGALVQLVMRHATNTAGVPVEPEQLRHLAFCWLANSLRQPTVLRNFQHSQD